MGSHNIHPPAKAQLSFPCSHESQFCASPEFKTIFDTPRFLAHEKWYSL